MSINRELALPACLAGSFLWKCKQAKIASGNFSMTGIWLLVSTCFCKGREHRRDIFVKYYRICNDFLPFRMDGIKLHIYLTAGTPKGKKPFDAT